MENLIKSFKYVPRIWAALAYIVLLGLSLFLFFGRNIDGIRIESLTDMFPDFYSHISNFSLTLIIFVTMGYMGLLFGIRLKQIIIIGIILVIINLIFEFFITVLNTPDKIDAIYGFIAVFLGLVFLFAMKKKGLRQNEL